jgi:hypothetical protein
VIFAPAAFDNGIICSHEQFVLAPEDSYEETIRLPLGKLNEVHPVS